MEEKYMDAWEYRDNRVAKLKKGTTEAAISNATIIDFFMSTKSTNINTAWLFPSEISRASNTEHFH